MSYRNPVLSGFHPDPSVCRVGTDYYLCTSSFCFFPGAPIHHSRDLVNWRLISNAWSSPACAPDGRTTADGMWAPSLRHVDDRFYVVSTNMPNRGHCIVTAVDPAGPWSDPVMVAAPGYDPDLFRDADGSTWLLAAVHGVGITAQRIDLTTGVLAGDALTIFTGWEDPFVEGPHLHHIDGWYYLICAEGGTGRGHMITVARSRELAGPYEHCPRNPVLTQRHRPLHHLQCAGHGDLFQDHAGRWWFVHLATRQFGSQHYLGRETFLTPVTWCEGWPLAAPLELEVDAPLPADPAPPTLPHERDDFTSATLGPQWIHLHRPRAEAWSLTERPSHVRLRYDHTALTSLDPTPLFIARRQQHVDMRFAITLDATPRADEEVGITIYQSQDYHYQLVLTAREGRRSALWRRRVGDMLVEQVQSLPAGPLVLAIESDWSSYHAYAEVGGERKRIGGGSPRFLSSELAGGFTGVVLALTATGPDCQRHADIDWAEYRALKA